MAIRPKIKLFGYSTIIYGFSNLLTKIVVLTLIPLYTTYLTVFEVGIIALLEMIELFVITIIPIGCVNAMWRYLPEEKGIKKNKIIISTFTIMILSGIFITGLLVLFRVSVGKVFNIPNDNNLLLFVFVSCFLRAISTFIYWLLQYKNQAFYYLKLSLIEFISLVGLTIYFIIGCNLGIMGIYYAKIIVFSTIFISTILFLIKTVTVLPSFDLIKKILSYGLPIIPLTLLTPVLTVSDRYFLNIFVSIEEIGQYGIAYKFGMLINMFLVMPIQRSWGPQMFQAGSSLKDDKSIHEDITFYYSFIGLYFLLGLSFFSDTIISIFANENYLSLSWLIPWISLAYFIGGFRMFFVASASLADRTDLFVKTGIYTIISNIILNYILIKHFGIRGAVASTILSYLILVGLLLITSKSINVIKWPIKKIFHGIFIATLLIIIFESIKDFSLTNNNIIIIKFILLLLFPIISISTNLIGQKEINGLRSIWYSIVKFSKIV